jgi:hypothetical protein
MVVVRGNGRVDPSQGDQVAGRPVVLRGLATIAAGRLGAAFSQAPG